MGVFLGVLGILGVLVILVIVIICHFHFIVLPLPLMTAIIIKCTVATTCDKHIMLVFFTYRVVSVGPAYCYVITIICLPLLVILIEPAIF